MLSSVGWLPLDEYPRPSNIDKGDSLQIQVSFIEASGHCRRDGLHDLSEVARDGEGRFRRERSSTGVSGRIGLLIWFGRPIAWRWT